MGFRLNFAVLLVCVLLASFLPAHAIERSTSFLRLDANADLVLAVDVKRTISRSQGALLEVLEVFRGSEDAPVKVGQTLETVDRVTSMTSTIYSEGVCFAFLKQHEGRYYSVLGAFANSVRKRADYQDDQLLNFLGSLVTREQVLGALQHHGELLPRLGVGDEDEARQMPLADQRPAIYADWLELDNPLLSVSALVDAYEIADEARPLFAASARALPASLLSELQDIALQGLEHDNQWVQSAGLAILERLGFPRRSYAALRALVVLESGEHLQIVRQESHRYFGTLDNLKRADIDLLISGLFDQSLSDLANDFAADGIRNAAMHPECLTMLREALADLLAREDAASLIAAARGCEAIDDPQCYQLLHQALHDEMPDFVVGEVRPYLAGWVDARNRDCLEVLIQADQGAYFLGEAATRALESQVLLGDQQALMYVAKLDQTRGGEDPQVLCALARLGSKPAARKLFSLARDKQEMRFDSYALKFLRDVEAVEAVDQELLEPILLLVAESRSTSFRREAFELVRDLFERDAINIETLPAFSSGWSVEALALRWLIGEQDQAMTEAFIECLERNDSEAARVCRLAEELEITALLPTIQALAKQETLTTKDWYLAYCRASALKRLADDPTDLEAFYRDVPLQEFAVVKLGRLPIEHALRRPEAKALLKRMITEGIVAKSGNTQAAQITRLLASMTGSYHGYAASLGLDAGAVERVQARWQAWYEEYADDLVWDTEHDVFRVE